MGYCVVLGMGLWVQNATADVVTKFCAGNTGSSLSCSCPVGYVVTSCVGGAEDSFVYSGRFSFNSSINPTTCYMSSGANTLAGITLICAKVCN